MSMWQRETQLRQLNQSRSSHQLIIKYELYLHAAVIPAIRCNENMAVLLSTSNEKVRDDWYPLVISSKTYCNYSLCATSSSSFLPHFCHIGLNNVKLTIHLLLFNVPWNDVSGITDIKCSLGTNVVLFSHLFYLKCTFIYHSALYSILPHLPPAVFLPALWE